MIALRARRWASTAILLTFLMWAGAGTPVARADVAPLESGGFVAGLPTESLVEVVARQRAPNWCWAACIEMVLNYHQVPVQQEVLVQRIYGGQIDAPATLPQILQALNGWAVEGDGRRVRVQATSFGLTPAVVLRDLTDRRPLIAGLVDGQGNGHTVVLTAVCYVLDAFGQPYFTYAVVRDPWPGSPSRQTVPWALFASRLAFLVRVGVAR